MKGLSVCVCVYRYACLNAIDFIACGKCIRIKYKIYMATISIAIGFYVTQGVILQQIYYPYTGLCLIQVEPINVEFLTKRCTIPYANTKGIFGCRYRCYVISEQSPRYFCGSRRYVNHMTDSNIASFSKENDNVLCQVRFANCNF